MSGISKEKFISGALWRIVEKFSTKGVSMLVSIVLARLLLPEDYGLIALTTVFTNLSDILIDGGFSTALIRKETVEKEDYSCVFAVSFTISAVLYVAFFATAPMISEYYAEPALTAVLRVIGLTFFIQAFSSTRTAVIHRNMQFKLLFYCNMIASVASGVVGIVSAWLGFGVWALVIQRLLQQALLTVILFIKIKWYFVWKIQWDRLKEILHFSMGVVGSSLVSYLSDSMYGVTIGKICSVTDLGYYDKGCQLPMQMSLYTFGAMSGVLLPTISSYQSNLSAVKAIVRKVYNMVCYLIMPMMLGMAFVSEELIVLLFTEKWLAAVPIMKAFCLYYFATPLMLINVQVFFALGKSYLRVKTELIRLVLNLFCVAVFGVMFNCSIVQLAIVSASVTVVLSGVTFSEVKKMIGYSWRELVQDVWKPTVASAVMGGVLFAVANLFINQSHIWSLLLKVAIGALSYFVMSIVLKIPGYQEIVGMLKRAFHKG